MTLNLLCATDGTEHSEKAVRFAIELVKRLGGRLAFLAVNTVHLKGRGMTSSLWTDEQAQEIVNSALDEAKRAGLSDTDAQVVSDDDPVIAIIEYAAKNGIDQIVVGTGGRSALSRLVLGSVANGVASRAHCPVTVVR